MRNLLVIAILIIVSLSAQAADMTVDDIITNLQANQTKIHDLYAETTTTMTSNMTLPGQESKGPQKMVQTARTWTKGQDKSKIEQLTPTRQITITNGDQMAIIDPESGQKVVQDLKKLRTQTGGLAGGQMSLAKAKEAFTFTVSRNDTGYLVTGVPKKANQFFGKMEIAIDSDKWVPVRITMYDMRSKPISRSDLEYQEIAGAWVPLSNKSLTITPMGQMDIQMDYEKVKVNSGLKDELFKI
jgi:outer membrane lipoprotein-sorting protein